jgi:sugar phosphate isomerase/epimerase
LKLGLSTWSLLGMDLESAVRAIGDANFEYIELWGEVPHAYPDWTDRKRLRDALSSYTMTLTMHAPFTDLNPSSPFQPVKGAVERTLQDFVKFGAFLGASMVTVHPGSVHNESLVPQSTQNSIETLRKMVKASDGRLSINIENQTKSKSKYHFPLASTVESLELMLAEVGGSQFTLDNGHAHVNGQDSMALAARFDAKLSEVHLSDNTGASDDHLIPGEGTAPLEGLMAKLAGSDILVCLELDPHRYTEEQVLGAASETKIRLGTSPRGRA